MSYESELQKCMDEYEDYKVKIRHLEAERENGVYSVSQREAEQLEKERQIKQMLSLLSRQKMQMMAEQLYQNQHHQTTKVGGRLEISTYDLDFVIAESLQMMESSENPRTEYHDWVQAEAKLENDLVSDGASQPEVDARNMFIDFLDDRETEMKRVMALYAASAVNGKGYYQEMARERFNFMQFKLSELRRLRTRMKSTTDRENVSEREVREQENRKSMGVQVAENMIVAGYTVNAMSNFMKDKVHGDDFENGIAGRIVQFRPETHNLEESEERIAALQQFSERQILMAQRMGLSRDDLVKQAMKTNNGNMGNEALDKARSMSGFVRSRFEQLQRQRESA